MRRNAAELLVPDRQHAARELKRALDHLQQVSQHHMQAARAGLIHQTDSLGGLVEQLLDISRLRLEHASELLQVLSPEAILRRGYAIVRQDGKQRQVCLAGDAN